MKNLKNKKFKWNTWHVLLVISLVMLCFFSNVKIASQSIADLGKVGVSQLDTISSYIQRVSKLELESNHNEELLLQLDIYMKEMIDSDGNSLYFDTTNEDIISLLQSFRAEYYVFVDAVYLYRENGVREQLFNSSEYNYTVSTAINKKITDYVDELSVAVEKADAFLMWNVCISVLILSILLLKMTRELRDNKDLSEKMYVDISTGLYNRAKCQEILNTPMQENNPKESAIIIFDLNDLKKTNDNLGHRAGDDLIASFAIQLRDAMQIFKDEIFVGRYGGDEFVAYLDSVEEKEVQMYLDEVQNLIDAFNRTAGKPFQLSCAAGYCITQKDNPSMTMRELFDQADVNMYENKMEMKRKKKEALLKQGIVEDVVDDRLA